MEIQKNYLNLWLKQKVLYYHYLLNKNDFLFIYKLFLINFYKMIFPYPKGIEVQTKNLDQNIVIKKSRIERIITNLMKLNPIKAENGVDFLIIR